MNCLRRSTPRFNDPNQDGSITLSELQATEIGQLVTLDVMGTLDAQFPIVASLAGLELADGTQAITITDLDLFDDQLPDIGTAGLNLEEVLNFNQLTAHGLFGLWQQLSGWLDSLRHSSVMDLALPFTDATLGDALDLKDAFVGAILGDLDNLRIVATHAAPANEQLADEFHFTLDVNGDPFEVSVPADENRSHLDALVSEINAALLVALGSGAVRAKMDRDALDGQQLTLVATDDSVTNLVVHGAEPLGFLADQRASTISFDSVQDLVELLKEMLGDSVVVHYDAGEDLLTFQLAFSENLVRTSFPLNFDLNLGPIAGLATSGRLDLDAVIEGGMTLGVLLEPRGDRPPTNLFFVQDAWFNGSLDVTVPDFDAAARLGIAALEIDNGTGSFHADVNVALNDHDDKVFFSDLLSGLSNPSALVNVGLSGQADLTLPVRLVPDIVPGGQGDPEITLHWTDISDLGSLDPPTLNQDFEDALDGLADLSFTDIILILGQFRGMLDDLEGTGLLGDKLPLVNRSISELIDISDALGVVIDALGDDPAATLETVEQLVGDAIDLSFVQHVLTIDLAVSEETSANLPFNLDLNLLDPDVGLGSLKGEEENGSLLSAKARAALTLGLEIDLTDPAVPVFYIKDTTGIELGAGSVSIRSTSICLSGHLACL